MSDLEWFVVVAILGAMSGWQVWTVRANPRSIFLHMCAGWMVAVTVMFAVAAGISRVIP